MAFVIRACPSSDVNVLFQGWIVKEYEAIVQRWNQQFQLPPNSIVNASANRGYTTLFLKKQYPGAEVVAIEPAETNIEILDQSINNNQLTEVLIEKKPYSIERQNFK